MPSRFKTQFEKPFDAFLRERYVEHHRRIVKGRSNARWALFTYPIGVCLLCVLPVGAITLAVRLLYAQNHPRVAEILKPESAPVVMPILYALCGAFALVGLLIGLSMGIGRAAQMIFESEKYELEVRQTYFLEKLFKAKRRKERTRRTDGTASGFAKGAGSGYAQEGQGGFTPGGGRATPPPPDMHIRPRE